MILCTLNSIFSFLETSNIIFNSDDRCYNIKCNAKQLVLLFIMDLPELLQEPNEDLILSLSYVNIQKMQDIFFHFFPRRNENENQSAPNIPEMAEVESRWGPLTVTEKNIFNSYVSNYILQSNGTTPEELESFVTYEIYFEFENDSVEPNNFSNETLQSLELNATPMRFLFLMYILNKSIQVTVKHKSHYE